ADGVVHVITGNEDLTQAVLVPGQDRHHCDDAGPQHPTDRVPVGKIDTVGAASRDGTDQVPGGDDERGQKDEADRPRPFAVFEIAVVVAEIQRNRTSQRGDVEQHEPDPGELYAV